MIVTFAIPNVLHLFLKARFSFCPSNDDSLYKNSKKVFLFHLESSFRSQDI